MSLQPTTDAGAAAESAGTFVPLIAEIGRLQGEMADGARSAEQTMDALLAFLAPREEAVTVTDAEIGVLLELLPEPPAAAMHLKDLNVLVLGGPSGRHDAVSLPRDARLRAVLDRSTTVLVVEYANAHPARHRRVPLL